MFQMLMIAATLGVLPVWQAAPAQAHTPDAARTEAEAPAAPSIFILRNDGTKVIETLLYGQSASDEWSDNILDRAVAPGGAIEVTFHDRLNGCRFDLYYVFTDGSDDIERVDVCALNGHVHRFGQARTDP